LTVRHGVAFVVAMARQRRFFGIGDIVVGGFGLDLRSFSSSARLQFALVALEENESSGQWWKRRQEVQNECHPISKASLHILSKKRLRNSSPMVTIKLGLFEGGSLRAIVAWA